MDPTTETTATDGTPNGTETEVCYDIGRPERIGGTWRCMIVRYPLGLKFLPYAQRYAAVAPSPEEARSKADEVVAALRDWDGRAAA